MAIDAEPRCYNMHSAYAGKGACKLPKLSMYAEKMEKARQTDCTHKKYLSEWEGAAYSGLGKTTFRSWAVQIGAKRKIGRRVIYDRSVIDAALKRGDTV